MMVGDGGNITSGDNEKIKICGSDQPLGKMLVIFSPLEFAS